MTSTTLPALDPRQRYTIPEAARYLRVSRAYLYRQISSGDLPSISDGKRRYIPGEVIAERSRLPHQAA